MEQGSNSNLDERIILALNNVRIQEIKELILSETKLYQNICTDISRIRSGEMDSMLKNHTGQETLIHDTLQNSTTSPTSVASSQASGLAQGINQKSNGKSNTSQESEKRNLEDQEESGTLLFLYPIEIQIN